MRFKEIIYIIYIYIIYNIYGAEAFLASPQHVTTTGVLRQAY